jgi:hypothetical protein
MASRFVCLASGRVRRILIAAVLLDASGVAISSIGGSAWCVQVDSTSAGVEHEYFNLSQGLVEDGVVPVSRSPTPKLPTVSTLGACDRADNGQEPTVQMPVVAGGVGGDGGDGGEHREGETPKPFFTRAVPPPITCIFDRAAADVWATMGMGEPLATEGRAPHSTGRTTIKAIKFLGRMSAVCDIATSEPRWVCHRPRFAHLYEVSPKVRDVAPGWILQQSPESLSHADPGGAPDRHRAKEIAETAETAAAEAQASSKTFHVACHEYSGCPEPVCHALRAGDYVWMPKPVRSHGIQR